MCAMLFSLLFLSDLDSVRGATQGCESFISLKFDADVNERRPRLLLLLNRHECSASLTTDSFIDEFVF